MSKHESLSQQIAEGEEFARSLKQQLKWEKAYSRIAELESALAEERKMTDKLAQALEQITTASITLLDNISAPPSFEDIELRYVEGVDANSLHKEYDKACAALSDWRTARGAK